MLFILSLTFGVLRFRIGNVLFLKHGYARWLAASPRVNTAHALTGRPEGPHCTAAPTYYIEKLQKSDTKKVRVPFPKVASAAVGGAGRRGRRAQTFAATGRLAEKAPYVKYIQGDVHSIYKLKLGVRHARAARPPLPTLTS